MKKLQLRAFFLSVLVLCMLAGCGNGVREKRLEGIDVLEKGKYEEAVRLFDEAMELSRGRISQEQFDILLYRAEAEYMTGDYDAAEETLRVLVQVDGEKDVYHRMLEQIDAKHLVKAAGEALNEGKTGDARRMMDDAVSKGLKNDRELEFNEAVYLEKTAAWEEALEAFRTYLRNYPGDPDAEKELAFLETRIEEFSTNDALREDLPALQAAK